MILKLNFLKSPINFVYKILYTIFNYLSLEFGNINIVLLVYNK